MAKKKKVVRHYVPLSPKKVDLVYNWLNETAFGGQLKRPHIEITSRLKAPDGTAAIGLYMGNEYTQTGRPGTIKIAIDGSNCSWHGFMDTLFHEMCHQFVREELIIDWWDIKDPHDAEWLETMQIGYERVVKSRGKDKYLK